MKKRITCILIILAMLVIGIIPVQAQESDPLVEQAVALYDAEDYDAAIPLLQEAADKGSAEAQNALATCYYYGDGVDKDVVQQISFPTDCNSAAF